MKKLEAPPPKDNEELVDPSNLSVIGAMDNEGSVKSPISAPPPDKKPKKDSKKDTKKEKSPSSKASKLQSQASADAKIELDSKWLEHFNRLEALIMAKNFEPTFSANVKVTPTHSPPSTVENVSEPFIRSSTSATLPGSGFSAEKHQPTSKAVTSRQTSSSKFPGTAFSASQHQPASQTKTSRPTSTTKFPGQGCSAIMHQPASQTKANRPTRQWTLVPTLQPRHSPQENMRLTNLLLPTGLCHLSLLTLVPLLYTGQEETAYLASPQMPVATCLTDLPWTYILRKGSCLRIRIRL